MTSDEVKYVLAKHIKDSEEATGDHATRMLWGVAHVCYVVDHDRIVAERDAEIARLREALERTLAALSHIATLQEERHVPPPSGEVHEAWDEALSVLQEYYPDDGLTAALEHRQS